MTTASDCRPADATKAEPISDHARRCLLTDDAGRDEIDLAAAVPDPPQKRSDRETKSVLKILDELERGQR